MRFVRNFGSNTHQRAKFMQVFRVQSSEIVQLRMVNFQDAHVEVWHEIPFDKSSTYFDGGAFFSRGSFTLTRSSLRVPGIVDNIILHLSYFELQ